MNGPRDPSRAADVLPPPAVTMRGVSKRYGPVHALHEADLELAAGTMLALLGPSGCGKTTCLRLIGGFERPDAGSIDIGGRRVASPSSIVPAEHRRAGFVFQDLALFPHLTTRQNVAYGIRRDPDRDVRTGELLELVGLEHDAARYPHELSGGMQQRVALARALAPRPDVLLLDEPFSSLDQAMRTQLRGEVRQILREARQSAILVTHDQDEALTIADRVAVMSRGRIEQVATPEIIYAAPETPFVATFVGVANLVRGEAHEGVVSTRFGAVPLLTSGGIRPEGAVLALLRPEHFSVREALDGPAGPDAWEVRDRRFSGSEILLEVTTSDGDRLWVAAGERVRHLTLGDRVELRLRAVETVAFGRHGHDAALVHRSHAPSTPEPAPAAPTATQQR